MSDTHINAYEMDVQEKLQAVQDAQGELAAAQTRLENKRKELGLSEEPAPKEEKKQDESQGDKKPGLLKKK